MGAQRRRVAFAGTAALLGFAAAGRAARAQANEERAVA